MLIMVSPLVQGQWPEYFKCGVLLDVRPAAVEGQQLADMGESWKRELTVPLSSLCSRGMCNPGVSFSQT